MTKKLIADANKPVHAHASSNQKFMAFQKKFVAADTLTAEAMKDVMQDRAKLAKFKKGSLSDSKAREWKPPSTNFI